MARLPGDPWSPATFARVPAELEIIGPASAWFVARVHEFCDATQGDPWGEVPSGRLVLARNLPEAFERYLPRNRFEAWAERHRNRRGRAWGLGMGFVARDGLPTAVVGALPEPETRNELLSLACHELLELSMGDSRDEEFADWHASMRRVVWSEHVVECRRTSVFESHGWPRAGIDRAFLVEEFEDYAREYRGWVDWAAGQDQIPNELFGCWQLLGRGVAVAYAHAQAGDTDEERELERFLGLQERAINTAWLDLMIACDRAFEHPQFSQDDLDVIGEEG